LTSAFRKEPSAGWFGSEGEVTTAHVFLVGRARQEHVFRIASQVLMSLPSSQSDSFDDESLVPVLRALVKCEARVLRVSSRHIQDLGLTGPQFDLLVTLGDLPGLSCSELGERTLTTRGTLFPVLDRLEARGLVKRTKGATDNRQTIVSLSAEGQTLYELSFEPHVEYMNSLFACLSQQESAQLIQLLNKVEARFATEDERTRKRETPVQSREV
jgi:MarR family 2-MHQ and catechol resistance regulon transcriptional repressor